MKALAGLASACILGLAGCTTTDIHANTAGPASTGVATPQAAPDPTVCNAALEASRGQWGQAEMHWITAETIPGASLHTVFQYLQLGEDAGTVALDQAEGKPATNDIAVYNSDFAGDSPLTAGC